MANQLTPIKAGRMARAVRRAAALVCLASMVLFLVLAGTSLALRFQWIEHVQLMPLALSAAVGMVLFWLLATALFGRIYCSVVCPMGVLQDIVARIPRLTRASRERLAYGYAEPQNRLRYIWLAVVVLTFIFGLPSVLMLFDPSSAFSRIVNALFLPIVDLGLGRQVVMASVAGIIVAVTTLTVVVAVAAASGRTLCNTVCPVGSALSIVSRGSIYAIDINTDLCIGCNRCQQVCKCKCIDPQSHTVDASRCVVCFDCLTECENGAIRYTRNRHRLQMPMLMTNDKPRAAAIDEASLAGGDNCAAPLRTESDLSK